VAATRTATAQQFSEDSHDGTLSRRPSLSPGRQRGLRVILLEDDPRAADLVTRAVEADEPGCAVLRVDGRSGFTRALEAFGPDVILSGHGVADFSALDAFRLAQARRSTAPFLLVSGAFEQTAADCLKAGAAEFVHTRDLARLSPAIRAAVELRAPLRRLSRRQFEVLQLVASGCSTREAAERLQVSVKTVETHRAQVMKRLEIHAVAGLVRYAIEVGIVSAGR
jgi:DNA-binding NarL/FixJ family response regulator